MIILLKKTPLNQNAANSLAGQYNIPKQNIYNYPFTKFAVSEQAHPTTCFVIDLNEDNFFKTNLTPENFAHELITAGLPLSVNDIYLLAPENMHDKPILIFAHHLAKFLHIKGRPAILVHCVSDMNNDQTQISLSDDKNNWKIFGIKTADEIAQQKNLLWQGNDLLTWLNSSQRTLTGITYEWGT